MRPAVHDIAYHTIRSPERPRRKRSHLRATARCSSCGRNICARSGLRGSACRCWRRLSPPGAAKETPDASLAVSVKASRTAKMARSAPKTCARTSTGFPGAIISPRNAVPLAAVTVEGSVMARATRAIRRPNASRDPPGQTRATSDYVEGKRSDHRGIGEMNVLGLW